MSIQSEITRIQNNVKNSLDVVAAHGVTVPDGANSDNLPSLIAQIGGTAVPSYWLSELETKADAIQMAMEAAGRNKSAFLWYTDEHWQTSPKVSPALMKYLTKHTPINKVNFGGDVISDPSPHDHETTKYAYEWREMIAGLPNHHSVYGNHDVFHRNKDYFDPVDNIAYTQLLAAEESADMVVGGDSYYYIDNPAEKTRYLYLSYFANDYTKTEMCEQGAFIADSLMSVAEGWHIVAIAHRWYQYVRNDQNHLVVEGGSVPTYEQEILNVFDAYNARDTHAKSTYFEAHDFSSGKGKVEFCIGGHIHIDYDFHSTGGIPVITTACSTNYERVNSETEDCGTLGTTTECAVFGIIADYSNAEQTKITVVGVGRGTSRTVYPAPAAVKHTNRILSSVESDGTPYNGGKGYKEEYRLNSSGVEKAASGCVTSGFIPYNGEDIELRIPNAGPANSNNYMHIYNSSHTSLPWTADGTVVDGSKHQIGSWVSDFGATRVIEDATGTQKIVIPKTLIHADTKYLRVSAMVETPLTADNFDLALNESVDQ